MANLHHGVRCWHTWGAHPPPPRWLPRRAARLGTASARPARPETAEIKSHIDPRGVVRQRAVPLMVTCVQCREEVLEADQIGDEEECLLRDHLLAVHPNTMQPETPGCCSGPSSSPSSRRRQRRSSAGGEGGRARRPCDGGLTQDPEQA